MRILLSLSLIPLFVGCGLLGLKQKDDDSSTPEKTEEVTPKSDSEGIVVGGISTASNATQLLAASGSSAIAGSSASFPVGALLIDTDVTIQEGSSLKSDSLESILGVAQGSLADGGPAVVVTADPSTNSVKPFSINLVTTASAGLLGSTFVVVFKTVDAETGKLTIGIIPTSEITIQGTKLTIKTNRFGVFQPLLTTIEITARVEQDTQEPIKTAKGDTPTPTPTPNPVPTPNADKVAPTLTLLVGPDRTVPGIAKNQAYTFVFSEKISAGSVAVSGTMKGAAAVQVQLSKTTAADDTVTITPSTGWILGDDKVLSVTVKDAAGNALKDTVAINAAVVNTIYYVHPTGSETGTGTASDPFLYFEDAMTAVIAADAQNFVYAAKGTYEEDVTFYPGIRLIGGFPDDKKWTSRDAKTNITIISGKVQGEIYAAPQLTESSFRTLTSYAQIDGFELAYTNSQGGSAIGLDINAPLGEWRIENNYIHTSGMSAVSAVAVTNAEDGQLNRGNARFVVRGNRMKAEIISGGSPQYCKGLEVNYAAASVVEYNIIECGDNALGSSSTAFAVADTIGNIRVHDNLIYSGTVSTGTAYGISIDSAETDGLDVEIRNNTIWAKTLNSQNQAIGLYVAFGGSLNSVKFDNNSLTAIAPASGQVSGISTSNSSSLKLLDTDLGVISTIRNNAISITATGGSEYIANNYTLISELNGDTDGTRSGNIGGLPYNMGFVDEANKDFKLTATSVLKTKGLNGKTAAWNFGGTYKDLAGVERGASWSIGAYQ